jgi:hypothetical protein
MLRSKIRVASLTAAALFALVAVYPSNSFLRMNAQEPAKAEGKESKIEVLKKDRLVTARELAKQQLQPSRCGRGLGITAG